MFLNRSYALIVRDLRNEIAIFFLLSSFFVAFGANSQNVTIINNFEGDSAALSRGDYVLRAITEHTYIVNQFDRVDNSPGTRLTELIDFSLRSYLETVYTVDGSKVEVRKDPVTVIKDLNAMVRNAIWLFDYEFEKEFPGFSATVSEMAARLSLLKGSQLDFTASTEANLSRGTVGFFDYQRQLLRMKERCNQEVNNYLTPRLPQSPPPVWRTSPRPVLLLPEDDMIKYQYIPPIDEQIQPVSGNFEELSNLQIDPFLISDARQGKPKKSKKQKQGDVYGERMVQLMEENNRILSRFDKRFDGLQDQIDDLKKQGVDPTLKQEVDELRLMVMSILEGRPYTGNDGRTIQRAEVQSIEVRFPKNEWELSWENRASLNSARDLLVRNRSYKVLITGYADRTGNSEWNVKLSQLRAESVRKYLSAAGITNDRLIVNYFGDTRSASVNPDDRKVTVEWLIDFTAEN